MTARRQVLAVLAVLAVAAGALAVGAGADRATVSLGAPQPWTGGARTVTPIEDVASRIASHIAGHTVSVSCQGVPRFRSAGGADASGLVTTLVNAGTGRYAMTATLIQLTSSVCGPLQRFAQAAQKPTRCSSLRGGPAVPCFIGASVARDARISSVCWGTRCLTVVEPGSSYWKAYSDYAHAILTLAHEAVHTQQALAGRPRVRDSLVEAQADCSGMQWMPWVAMQLGDSADDAQSIANFFWSGPYPEETSLPGTRPYWSSDCRPGGQLDVRAADATAWP